MESQKIMKHRKAANWTVSGVIMIFLLSSCAMVKNNKSESLLGGYELYGYNTPSDVHGKMTIHGIAYLGNTKKTVKDANVLALDTLDDIIVRTKTDDKGRFKLTFAQEMYLGGLEIRKDIDAIYISGIDVSGKHKNLRIRARLFNYDYSHTERDFPEDMREELRMEIEMMKNKEKEIEKMNRKNKK